MFIKRLVINDFRILEMVDLEPCDGFNFICGPNGSGKTSILESIHYLSLMRSFRSNNAHYLIRTSQPKLELFARLKEENLEIDTTIGVSRERNGDAVLKINGSTAPRIMDLLDHICVQTLYPQGVDLICSESEERRKFIDWGTFYAYEEFKKLWQQYRKLLKQRNSILRKEKERLQKARQFGYSMSYNQNSNEGFYGNNKPQLSVSPDNGFNYYVNNSFSNIDNQALNQARGSINNDFESHQYVLNNNNRDDLNILNSSSDIRSRNNSDIFNTAPNEPDALYQPLNVNNFNNNNVIANGDNFNSISSNLEAKVHGSHEIGHQVSGHQLTGSHLPWLQDAKNTSYASKNINLSDAGAVSKTQSWSYEEGAFTNKQDSLNENSNKGNASNLESNSNRVPLNSVYNNGFSELEVWDDALSEIGSKITAMRSNYLASLQEVLSELIESFLPKFKIKFELNCGWNDSLDYRQVLAQNLEKDRGLGYTFYGCHKADLRIKNNTISAGSTLSRGQLKMLVYAMRLAQGKLFKEQTNRSCIYLIDDLNSELDDTSQRNLLNALLQCNHQVFISNIQKDVLIPKDNSEFKIFSLEGGMVK